jgi:hypothetical protein
MSIQNNSLHAFHLLAEIFGNLQFKELKVNYCANTSEDLALRYIFPRADLQVCIVTVS